MDFSIFLTTDAWLALITLTVLEIVLGIDNIIFISILSGKLPASQQKSPSSGSGTGYDHQSAAAVIAQLDHGYGKELFSVLGKGISGRDLILLLGGLFLLYKATTEIHSKLEGEEEEHKTVRVPSFNGVIVQILLLDIVFSLDSVITAVGMADEVLVMIIAVVIAVLIMLWAADPISDFVNKPPRSRCWHLHFWS